MKKSNDTLIDSKVSSNQTKLALDALLKHSLKHKVDKEKNELLPGKEQFVWLTIAVKRIHAEKKLKPSKIPLKHPLIDPRTTSICLITKDPQREYKDLLESNNIKFISRVVGIQKLKGKFKPFEARRMLLKENGLFLADERVVPLLPKLLGKPFFAAKKQPIPVCMTRKELKKELEQAVSSTYFHQNQGTCASVKIGTLGSHDATELLDNITTALPSIVKNVRGEWTNVQSIHVKTNSSASLPIWSCELDGSEGGRWDGLTKPLDVDDNEKEEEEKIEEESSDVEEPVVEVKKGKKRAAVTDEEPQKKKKVKVLQEEKNAAASSPGPKLNSQGKVAKKTKIIGQEARQSEQEDLTKKQKQVKKKEKTAAMVEQDQQSANPKSTSKAQAIVLPPSPQLLEPVKPKKSSKKATKDPSVAIEPPVLEAATKREKKRPVAADFIEPEALVSASIPASASDELTKKKKSTPGNKLAPEVSSKSPAANSKSPVKSKAVTSGIDKKKEKVVGGLKPKGKSVKDGLLRKKAAGR